MILISSGVEGNRPSASASDNAESKRQTDDATQIEQLPAVQDSVAKVDMPGAGQSRRPKGALSDWTRLLKVKSLNCPARRSSTGTRNRPAPKFRMEAVRMAVPGPGNRMR
jgi:hypothetical protein